MSKKACNQDYNSEFNIKLRLEYIEDVYQLDILLKSTSKLETAIVKTIEEENYSEKLKSTILLGYEHDVSQSTMLNILT